MGDQGGRPTLLTQDVADQICLLIADGMSLQAICRKDEMPHRVTVLRWLQKHDWFRTQYCEARECQAELWADEIIDIADDNSRDIKEIERNGQIVQVTDSDTINRAKLRVDSRKWILSKILPKKYGDMAHLKLSNPDGGPVEIRSLSDGQLADKLCAVLARIERLGITVSARGVGCSDGGDGAAEAQPQNILDVPGDRPAKA